MPIYRYCPEKNIKLIDERGISFDEIIAAIESGELLDILEHGNQEKYKGQKIYVVTAKAYIYLVPFVIDVDGNIFLKTIIPSRQAKNRYLRRKNEKN